MEESGRIPLVIPESDEALDVFCAAWDEKIEKGKVSAQVTMR
jgi:hypothetical protein